MNESLIFWPNYLFFTDFSDDAASLQEFLVGPVNAADATTLAALLGTHDTGQGRALWTDQPANVWTTAGATIKYNGANNTGLPSNALFQQVLILQLVCPADAPVDFVGIHYNIPPPPAV